MGICVSTARSVGEQRPSAKVVDMEGSLQEFRRRVTAEEVLSLHPSCYLCSADSILIDSNAPPLPQDHALQLGQIYFLMPLSKSLTPLSLQDLCHLAIKASTALCLTNTTSTLFPLGCRIFRFSGGSCRNFVTF